VAQAEVATPRADAYVHSRVLDAVRETGEARVIVVMGDPALPEARARNWRLRGPANAELARRVMQAAPRCQVTRQYRLFPFLAGRVDEEGLRELAACSTVEAVYPDREVRAALDDSGPLLGQPTAEAAGYDGTGVGIAILDTGIGHTHPDLGGSADEGEFPNSKVVGGYDVINRDDLPMDDHGHGTYVAGIAAGTGTTYRGMAPGAHLIAVKVLDRSGTGTASTVIAGIEWCIEHRDDHSIRVINLSLGDGTEWSDPEECDAEPEGQAIGDAVDNGIVVVASAGNDEYDRGVSLPACVTDAIAVGATYDADYEGDLWSCKDASPSADDIACFSNRGELLEVFAPGAIITSADLGGSYRDASGTSASAPHVAGAAAVLFDKLGLGTSPTEIRGRLTRTGIPIIDPATEVTTPRIDLARAIDDLPAPAPDLLVTQVMADRDSGLVGEALELNVTVRNSGDAASGPCTALVVLSANGIATPHDPAMVSVAVPALNPGESHASGWVGRAVPDLRPQEYRVGAYVDSSYVVAEKDEWNNGMVGAGLTVEGSSSYVMRSSIPESMLKGQTYEISVTLWNGGTRAWTEAEGFALKSVSPEGTERWGITTVPLPEGQTVDVGQTATFTFSVTAPDEPELYPCHWRMARGADYFGELATGATKTQVVEDTMYGQWRPAVSGDWAAYMDFGGLYGDLFIPAISVMHLPTLWTLTLPDDIDFPQDTRGVPSPPYTYFDVSSHYFPDISATWVTWCAKDRLRAGDDPLDPESVWYLQVTAYNVEEAEELPRRIVYGEWDAVYPSIDGNLVVWEDYRDDPDRVRNPSDFMGDNADIYIHDLETSTTRPLCAAPGPQLLPRISGDLVEWEDWRDATPDSQSDIYVYDLSVDTDGDGIPNWRDSDRPSPDPAEVMVTDSDWPEQCPDVSGRHVVWLDLRRDTGTRTVMGVYLRDLDAPTATAVAVQPATFREQPRVAGTKVTWTDHRRDQGDLYWVDTATGAGGPIAGRYADEGYSGMSGDRVVYLKHVATLTRDDPGIEPHRPWPVYNIWVDDMLPEGSVGVHTFVDVPSDFWAWQYVEAVAGNGVARGFEDGTYQPGRDVTRDQMAVYISRALASGDESVPDYTGTPTFADIASEHWALDYVEYAVAQNIVAGYDDGNYHPEHRVARDQMAVYVARALVAPSGEAGLADYVPADPRNFPDVPEAFWAHKHVEYCVENGVVAGHVDGNYHPEYPVARDQMAVYIARAFGLQT
jgi:beta propeller repeat protein